MPSRPPLTTSTGSTAAVWREAPRGCPTTLISISRRPAPDDGVRVLGMEPAGGGGGARSGRHSSSDCTRPSERRVSRLNPDPQPPASLVLLSASHNPQGGDDGETSGVNVNLNFGTAILASAPVLPKPCALGSEGRRTRGSGVSAS